ncbi:hypothetical protein PZA11_004326 [Diplocarpon coronariae]
MAHDTVDLHMADILIYRPPRNLAPRQFTMSSNSTSMVAAVPSPTASDPASTPGASASASVPVPPSSSADSSPTPVPTTEPSATSSVLSLSISSSPATTTPATPPTSEAASTASVSSTAASSARSNTPVTTASTPAITSATHASSITPVVSTLTSTNQDGSTVTIVTTSTATPTQNPQDGTTTHSSASNSATADLQGSGGGSGGGGSGLSNSGTIAVAVVVPIVAVALLILAGLFFWRKRKARKDAEELRRKEVEEYGYNPNNDPTLPAAGGTGSAGNDGSYETREDGSSGYRGWGTTAMAPSGRKASTTLSGGQSAGGGHGMSYSGGTSPTHGTLSDTRSDNPLVDGRPLSPEAETLGAMGPAASGNRAGSINRGPSNASSSYSAAARSDGSGEGSGGGYYNNQYDSGNPYSGETQYGSPPAEVGGQPIIRDVQARRNTRIENPSHFPQQSAGISQNF